MGNKSSADRSTNEIQTRAEVPREVAVLRYGDRIVGAIRIKNSKLTKSNSSQQ